MNTINIDWENFEERPDGSMVRVRNSAEYDPRPGLAYIEIGMKVYDAVECKQGTVVGFTESSKRGLIGVSILLDGEDQPIIYATADNLREIMK